MNKYTHEINLLHRYHQKKEYIDSRKGRFIHFFYRGYIETKKEVVVVSYNCSIEAPAKLEM